jgi:hypothetical protein
LRRRGPAGSVAAVRVVLIAALLCVLAAVAVQQAGAKAPCTAGVKTVGGVTQRTFCGPAKATVHYGTHTWNFTQGECSKSGGYFTVNIGTVVLGMTGKPKPDYLGVTAQGAKAVAIAVDHGGKGYAVRADTAKVKLLPGQKGGTFSGTSFADGTKVTGSFSCS